MALELIGDLKDLVERFGPVWDACKKYGVTFDLECHPSERAMGDLEWVKGLKQEVLQSLRDQKQKPPAPTSEKKAA